MFAVHVVVADYGRYKYATTTFGKVNVSYNAKGEAIMVANGESGET